MRRWRWRRRWALGTAPAPARVSRDAIVAARLGRLAPIVAVLILQMFVLELGGHLVPVFHHWVAARIGMQTFWVIQFLLATAVLAGPEAQFFAKGIQALLRGAQGMYARAMLGTSAASGFSTVALLGPGLLPARTLTVYFEAAAVIVTRILTGCWLDARAKSRRGGAIRKLVRLRPATARVERGAEVVEVPVKEVRRADLLRLLPGEWITVDGVVREGQSFGDESMMTGEPVLVEKLKGARLAGATVYGNGALRMRATDVGADMMLSRIIAMVGAAQGARLPAQDLMNRITLWFVPAVMAVALVTVAGWLLFGTAPALPFALVPAAAVLIIACPCAMGLAVPVSIMVGTRSATELGGRFRRGNALQGLASVDVVAFDKTGTLTEGTPVLAGIAPPGRSEEDLLVPAAAGVLDPLWGTDVACIGGWGDGGVACARLGQCLAHARHAEDGMNIGDVAAQPGTAGKDHQVL